MSEDSLDIERLEERWSNVNEDFLDQISIDCYNECEHHQIRALWLKRLYFVLSIVNIILPSLQLTNFIPLTTQKYLTFIIAELFTFTRYSPKNLEEKKKRIVFFVSFFT